MMKNKMKWLCLALSWSAIVHAEVYEWIDSQGHSHYSDRGHDDARVLKIQPGTAGFAVKKVYDGDTLLLSDGRKIRFLGVNTPEVEGRHKSAEAGGERAKVWLRQRLEGRKVSLQFDVEKEDKYQRTLAHVFDQDKRHINLELIERGLAMASIYPPNLKFVEALVAAQQRAKQAGLGIWSMQEYAPRDFSLLTTEDYKGWRRLRGRVKAVKRTRKYSYLQFSDTVAVQVANEWLKLFPQLDRYVGKQVEVRGWANKSREHLSVRARHPADIDVLD